MIIIINKRESLRMSDCVCVTYMFSKYHKHVIVSRGKLKPQWFKTKQKKLHITVLFAMTVKVHRKHHL